MHTAASLVPGAVPPSRRRRRSGDRRSGDWATGRSHRLRSDTTDAELVALWLHGKSPTPSALTATTSRLSGDSPASRCATYLGFDAHSCCEGPDTKRNFQHVKDRGEAGPIGHRDRYSIEQTPSDRIIFCSKTGSTLRRRSRATRSPLGWEPIISFRLAITTGKRRRRLGPAQFRPPWSPCTRSSHRLAC